MRTATLLTLTIILTVGMLVIAGSVKAQTSIIHDQDIQKLMATAEATFDMTKEDAVLLFDCEENHWLPDKRLKKVVHRIIWINTDNAVDRYGDNRIPFDEKECNFDVITVRTWRDGQWCFGDSIHH